MVTSEAIRLTRKVYWLFRAAGLPPIASHRPHASRQLETRSSSRTRPARRRGGSATDAQRVDYAAQLRYALLQLPDGLEPIGGSADPASWRVMFVTRSSTASRRPEGRSVAGATGGRPGSGHSER
jgi:hypothetical protein